MSRSCTCRHLISENDYYLWRLSWGSVLTLSNDACSGAETWSAGAWQGGLPSCTWIQCVPGDMAAQWAETPTVCGEQQALMGKGAPPHTSLQPGSVLLSAHPPVGQE